MQSFTLVPPLPTDDDDNTPLWNEEETEGDNTSHFSWHKAIRDGLFVLISLTVASGVVLVVLWQMGVLWSVVASSPYTYTPATVPRVNFTSPPTLQYLTWNDTSNHSIQAHGAGVLIDPIDHSYWWVGETAKLEDTTGRGINLYHSTDLVQWVYIGKILSLTDMPSSVMGYTPIIMERPKLVYNPTTRKYVLWFHMDDSTYSMNFAAVATASQPQGPYGLISVSRPDEVPIKDLTVYPPYLVYSAFINSAWVLAFSQLSDSTGWTTTTGIITTINQPYEAPAVFGYGGYLYVIASHMNGWGPNRHYLYHASPRGVLTSNTYWDLSLTPLFPTDVNTSYGAQSAYVLPVVQPDKLVMLLLLMDRWIGGVFPSQQLPNSSYTWVPINLDGQTWTAPNLPQIAHPSLTNSEAITYYDAALLLL